MKFLLSCACCILGLVSFAASPAATREWVRMYCATNSGGAGTVSQVITNGTITMTGFSGTGNWVRVTAEYPDKLALVASNVTANALTSGVTNGMIFAWNGSGEVHNAPAGLFISCVSNECFCFCGINSSKVNGVDAFAYLFEVRGTKITWSMSERLLGQQQSSVGFDPLSLLFPFAWAALWSDIEWYTPSEFVMVDPSLCYWTVTDSEGGPPQMLEYDYEGNCLNYDDVIGSMTLNPRMVLDNLIGLSQGLVKAQIDISVHDQQLQEISENLNKEFVKAWGKLEEIEKRLEEPKDDGSTEATTETETIIEKRTDRIIINGGNKALKVDGKSIGVKDEKTEHAAYQLKNFPNISQDTGKIPFFSMVGQNPVLNWYAPKDDIDGESIVADVVSGYPNQIVNAGDKHGIHLAGWYTPTQSPNRCESGDSIAEQLKRGDNTHYVLTKHKNLNALHYTEVGQLVSGGGCALKFRSTTDNPGQEIVVGESSVTNTVTFASNGDSNVRVTVGGTSGKNGNVTITFGVYYK